MEEPNANANQQPPPMGMIGLEMSLHHHNPPIPNSIDTLVLTPTPDNSSADTKTSPSPPLAWHRMKWTDNMVRLLIMVVYYIGDEVSDDPNKKNPNPNQKKGKWKSVSNAMMERGFFVSPQQCEDKFNDLNKRYKRVNDILGKGTACRVVDNPSLLDTMDHLTPKAKDEVKKLLNSKHLFFREMCAYHNTCATTDPPPPPPHHHHCLHSTQNNSHRGSKLEEDEEDDDVETIEERNNIVADADSGIVTAVVQDRTTSAAEKMQWLKMKGMQLEEHRATLHLRAMELDKQRLKWLKYSTNKEREMERQRLVYERMNLENQRMVLMIRSKELDFMEQHNHHTN